MVSYNYSSIESSSFTENIQRKDSLPFEDHGFGSYILVESSGTRIFIPNFVLNPWGFVPEGGSLFFIDSSTHLIDSILDLADVEGEEEVREYLDKHLHILQVLKDGILEIGTLSFKKPTLSMFYDPEEHGWRELQVLVPGHSEEDWKKWESFRKDWLKINFKRINYLVHFTYVPIEQDI